MRKLHIGVAAALLCATALWSWVDASPTAAAVATSANRASSSGPATATIVSNPERTALFGDLHLHTAYSTDAVLLVRTVVTPDQAYRYAQGQPVTVMGQTVRMSRPLDFLAVTDHAELIGAGVDLMNPDSAAGRTPFATQMRTSGAAPEALLRKLFTSKNPVPGIDWAGIGQSAWQRYVAMAERNNHPGRFTALIGYEWSATPGFQNLHRNVIFRSSKVAYPYSAADSERPEDLWTHMEANRRRGIESLAIPHNGDLSNGLMYAWTDSDGRPISRSYALRRAKNEPLNEIVQTKGQSEVHPALATNDEFANFEVYAKLFSTKKEGTLEGSYFRDALGRGLAISEMVGANPYKSGVVGGSDVHSGLLVPEESQYRGSYGPLDQPTREQLEVILGYGKDVTPVDNVETSAGDMTGVWAESNTRSSIYDALRRRETFATSGPRMKVRLFGGWSYARSTLDARRWKDAYAGGTPMGGDLPVRPATARAPRFLVWAIKDPQGANLDRAQIIKIWMVGKQIRQKVFDVALSDGRVVDPATGKAPPVGNSVDLKEATYKNTIGASELATLWIDPEFDPGAPAAYYVRVIEIPTPRWSTVLANKIGAPLPTSVPASIQERAWSSPIWYAPKRPRG